ncbi:MAG: hypothetical protein M1825_002310 [Sarcosagium campestre]|nr:MAG: hypothetical protein M1825_002310 [Sarcosagium campestre]
MENSGTNLQLSIAAEQKKFWATNANLSPDDRQKSWERHLKEVFERYTAPSVPQSSSRTSTAVNRRRLPGSDRSLSFGGHTILGTPPIQKSLSAVSRRRVLSNASAPAASSVAMSRSASLRSANSRNQDLFLATITDQMPLETFVTNNGHVISSMGAWDAQSQQDEPYNVLAPDTCTSSFQTKSSAGSANELDDFGVLPYDFLTNNGFGNSHLPSVSVLPSPLRSPPSNFPHQDSQRLSISSDASPAFDQGPGFFDFSSPSNLSSAELTQATTAPTDMSRSQSTSETPLCESLNMLHCRSLGGMSDGSSIGNSSRSELTLSMGTQTKGEMTRLDKDFDLRGTGGCIEEVSSAAYGHATPLLQHEESTAHMQRVGSNGSTNSERSDRSTRNREILENGTRPILPKSSTAHDDRKCALTTDEVTTNSPGGSSRRRLPIEPSKRKYARRTSRQRVWCKLCPDRPAGFKGDHELRRHMASKHAGAKKVVWICEDQSPDKKFLSNCKACMEKRQYNIYYNAAAHLRRTHFNPRSKKNDSSTMTSRAGSSGGQDPPMKELKKWLKEVHLPDAASNLIPVQTEPLQQSLDTLTSASTNPFTPNPEQFTPYFDDPLGLLGFTNEHSPFPNANTNILLPSAGGDINTRIDAAQMARDTLLIDSDGVLSLRDISLEGGSIEPISLHETFPEFRSDDDPFIDPSLCNP